MIDWASRETITSRQNPSVISACKLVDKKHRDLEGKFRIDGVKLFEEAVLSGVNIETVFIRQGSLERLHGRIEKLLERLYKADVKILSDSVFEKLSEEKSPEGIICVVKYVGNLHVNVKANAPISDEHVSAKSKIFAVESVRDPGNMGTIIRTAAAFGVDCLLISSDCADIYNPRAVRAAMGALFRQKIVRVDDLPAALKHLSENGRKTYAATLGKEAVLLGQGTLNANACIVVGNEGHGLSEDTVNACDHNILIPMAVGAESLNAAVAASVCMWEQFGKSVSNDI